MDRSISKAERRRQFWAGLIIGTLTTTGAVLALACLPSCAAWPVPILNFTLAAMSWE
jgi:hypothetical protein